MNEYYDERNNAQRFKKQSISRFACPKKRRKKSIMSLSWRGIYWVKSIINNASLAQWVTKEMYDDFRIHKRKSKWPIMLTPDL